MRIKKSVSKNSVSYSVIDNIRGVDGKSTTKVIESLGNEQQIREKHPGVDPEEWARAYAKKLTLEQKLKTEKATDSQYSIRQELRDFDRQLQGAREDLRYLERRLRH